MIERFFEGNVPSLKNSKQFIPSRTTKSGKTIPSMLIPSETVKKYLSSYSYQFMQAKVKTDNYPIIIAFHFIRDSKRRFDFGNACQIILDLFVKHGWIEDDSMDYIVPVPFRMNGKWFSLNPEKPGVIVRFYTEKEIDTMIIL